MSVKVITGSALIGVGVLTAIIITLPSVQKSLGSDSGLRVGLYILCVAAIIGGVILLLLPKDKNTDMARELALRAEWRRKKAAEQLAAAQRELEAARTQAELEAARKAVADAQAKADAAVLAAQKAAADAQAAAAKAIALKPADPNQTVLAQANVAPSQVLALLR